MRTLRKGYLHDWEIAEPQQVDWVSGACLVARREAVQQVGGLDEQMFMYFEDNDWCRRMRLAGWQVWYNPSAEVTHIGGASLNQNPEARAAYYRSLAYFYRKHYGQAAGAAMDALTRLAALISSCAALIRRAGRSPWPPRPRPSRGQIRDR